MTPDQLSTTIVDVLTALVADGVRDAARRRPDLRDRGATPAEGARRLRHQRRDAAGEEGRDQPPRLRRAGRRPASRPPRGWPRSRSPARASSTSPWPPAPRARSPRTSSRPARRTAPRTRSPGEKINLEFVSANPTGPLHIGAVRWAAVGDALGRVFTTAGARSPASTTSTTTAPRWTGSAPRCWPGRKGRPVPEDGYGGEYIDEIAKDVVAEAARGRSTSPRTRPRRSFRAEGVELMFAEIKQSLHDFGVDFDVYFHEDNLHTQRRRQRAVERLTELGNTYEQDGATWLATEKFGDDKDRVIIKSDGRADLPRPATSPTTSTSASAASTAALIMLGADHHGYVGRMMAMCAALRRRARHEPRDPHRPDGEPAARGPAAADVEAGRHGRHHRRPRRAPSASTPPATPWPATARTPTSTSTSTCGPRRRNDNPVYYVQYGHARTCRMMENAADLGMSLPVGDDGVRPVAALATSSRASCCARWPSSRGWSPAPPSCASRTGSPATSRTPPRSSTSGTTPGVPDAARRATSRPGRSTRRASCWSPPPARCWPTASALLGVSAPERM